MASDFSGLSSSSIPFSLRGYFDRRKSQLELERESFISHYKDLSEFISPRRGRFELSDNDRGGKRHQSIINSKGTQALTTASAGLFAGVMSPARPWFELAVSDPELSAFPPVKRWLKQNEMTMRQIFNGSNLYVMAPVMIRELILFGTGCMTQVDDSEDLTRFYTHTVGSYMIGQDDRFRVNTLIRQYIMTVEQMALEFGLENMSTAAQDQVDRGNLSSEFIITHIIEPNDDFRFGNPMAKFKKFRSAKYESGRGSAGTGSGVADSVAGSIERGKFLKQSGFDEFPAYVPRWGVTGEDTYGTDCPGMTTLGDVKQLQIQEKRKAQGIDKMVNPPLTGPASVRNVPVSSLPGGLTLYDGDSTRNKLEALYSVNLPLGQLIDDMDRVERRIEAAFFVDLFLAISSMEGIQPRNELELSERNAERLLQLGPVLERVHGEFLDPLISRTFNQMVRADLVPPPPEEIAGQPLEVNYISSLALAQRAVDTRPIERTAQFVAGLVDSNLSDGKVFNGDAAVKKFAQLNGTPPDVITPDDVMADERAFEAQQAQMQNSSEITEQLSRAAASASQVDLNKNTPVTAAISRINEQQRRGT